MLKIVVIKLIAPKIEEAPAKCKLKIAKSTDGPECAAIPDKGGYTVHAVPAPDSTNDENNNKIIAGGNNQKLILFKRGNAISGYPEAPFPDFIRSPPREVQCDVRRTGRSTTAT